MNCTQVVTIGRNVGAEPMPVSSWVSFQLAVRHAIQDCGGVIVQQPAIGAECTSQTGSWEGAAVEDASTFVAFVPQLRAYEVSPALERIASRFRQEAIGLIVVNGTDHLVKPRQSLPLGATTADGFVVGV